MKRKAIAVFLSFLILISILNIFNGCSKKEEHIDAVEKYTIEDLNKNMRTEINLNNNWKYHQGKIKDCTNILFNDDSWQSVNLPHNTSLYTKDNKNAYQGISVYRKYFSFDYNYKGKRLLLTFEGVMQRCKVYLNGKEIAENNNGYIPFCIDISNDIRYDEGNVLTVVTDNRASHKYTPGKDSPDFQYFGGIYRNVNITVTDNIFITNSVEENETAGGGIFITSPTVEKDKAVINVKTQVKNLIGTTDITLKTEVLYDNKVVANNEQALTCKNYEQFDCNLTISNPLLWHPYTPYLYTIKSSVYVGDSLVDELSTEYGIRKIEWTHEGLYINDERFMAQGANLHSDIFVLGNAIPDNEVFEEIKRLKENGFDFIRMSHYPHSKAYYDACDKYGVLVLNCMSGWQYFSNKPSFKNSTYDELRTMIRYSRNHPSIIAWETSLNESNYNSSWAKKINAIAHEEYPKNGESRMWTAGWKTDEFDIMLGASQHDIRKLANDSDKGVIISEYGDWDYGGTTSTSRVKREGDDSNMLTQAGNHIESAILTRNQNWYGADALWCYDDYAGCDTIMNYGGIVDMYRINKYSAYFYKSQRDASADMREFGVNTGAMLFIANRLDNNSPNDVTIFSNCDEIELFADGKSLGKQKPDNEYYGNNSEKMLSTESLPHPPTTFKNANNKANELVAVGYINGKEVTKQTVTKPQNAAAIKLKAESNEPIKANGSDVKLVWVNIVDENGTIVKDDKYVSFKVENGYVIGYESVNTVGAQIGVWVKANSSKEDTTLTLTATADDLGNDSITIAVRGDSTIKSSADCNEFAGISEGENISVNKGENLALNKKAIASSENKGTEQASLAVDGDEHTWWCADNAQTQPHYWQIDLGEKISFNNICIAFEDQKTTAYSFILQGSNDESDWQTIKDYRNQNEPNGLLDIALENSVSYRYLRIYDLKTNNDYWPTIAEFGVYNTKLSLDVAREKPAYSSTNADGCVAEYGNNGEPSTYWYPATADENWWYVDTGDTYNFERIEITWNAEEKHSFVIEISDDAENWTQILDCSNGKKEYQTAEQISGNGRYVRIKLKSKTKSPQGFNMFYVYGK